MAWAWVLSAIGYGKKYLNRRHRVLGYLNQAVYPFYILHQTIIVILVYYVVQTRDTIGLKYSFIVGVTFVVTTGIYHLFIRPFPLMRWLFGMKPLERAMRGCRGCEVAGDARLPGNARELKGGESPVRTGNEVDIKSYLDN